MSRILPKPHDVVAPTANNMIAVGQSIGNYTLTAKLGEGGMGVVYLAEHPIIGRRVAMKVVHPELLRNPEVVSRFITEAKSVNQIGNEHIVDILDFGTTADGEFYFVMEFLQGEALAEYLKRAGPMDATRALPIAAQVADALGASHQHHIVHRDLKPENIFLITKGRVADFVKVLDFGLAKLTMGDNRVSHKTRPGSAMGTIFYMAPEQCEGKMSIDHRADIYSLGVILFEMVTGKVPFSGEGYGEMIVKHITADVPSPRIINPRVSPSIEAVIMRALAKRRENRFQTMEEFAAALFDPDSFAAGALVSGSPTVRGIPAVFMGAAQVSPARLSESVESSPVVLGNPDQKAGARSVPMPSTFRQAVGEETNADQSKHVSKPGRMRLIAAVAVAVIVAGIASYYFNLRRPAQAPPQPPTVVVPEPVVPRKAKLDFKSDPPGAVVLRGDTNVQLGITPFVIELPIATAPIDFLFKKEGFRGFENVDEKTNFYSYPGKGRYYGGPVLTSYFWYCFKSAFTKLGVNVFEEGQGPSGAPTMDVKLVRIAEDGFTANVTVAVSSGRPPLMKSYTIAGPTITDFQKSALESRAYQMMTALFWSVASDPQFQAIVAP